MFVEENLFLNEVLNFSLPQFPSCISIYSIVYIYIKSIYFMCVHMHTYQPLVEWWCLKHMRLFSCACFLEQMRTYITGKLRNLPLKKSMEDWIIKARPLESSWAYLSHTTILPPKYTVSPLTTGRVRGCFPNMPFPHRGTQPVAVCQSSKEKLMHNIWLWPLCTVARVL